MEQRRNRPTDRRARTPARRSGGRDRGGAGRTEEAMGGASKPRRADADERVARPSGACAPGRREPGFLLTAPGPPRPRFPLNDTGGVVVAGLGPIRRSMTSREALRVRLRLRCRGSGLAVPPPSVDFPGSTSARVRLAAKSVPSALSASPRVVEGFPRSATSIRRHDRRDDRREERTAGPYATPRRGAPAHHDVRLDLAVCPSPRSPARS